MQGRIRAFCLVERHKKHVGINDDLSHDADTGSKASESLADVNLHTLRVATSTQTFISAKYNA